MSPARNAPTRYHVVRNPEGRWELKRAKANRPSATFQRKSDAVAHAQDVIRQAGGELVIHGKDGRIREATTVPKGYGSLKGELVSRKGIDLTKPIYEQSIRATKK